jgi:hypothetical protein
VLCGGLMALRFFSIKFLNKDLTLNAFLVILVSCWHLESAKKFFDFLDVQVGL